jgi:hypothetical protein
MTIEHFSFIYLPIDTALTLLSTVNELSSVHSFNSQEILLAGFESVRIPEVDNSKRSTTTRVMDDILHRQKTRDVLNKRQLSELQQGELIHRTCSETTSSYKIHIISIKDGRIIMHHCRV